MPPWRMDTEGLKARILERLAVLELSQSEASRRMKHVGAEHVIRNVLRGATGFPRADNIKKLAKVLQCRPEWLLSGEGDPEDDYEDREREFFEVYRLLNADERDLLLAMAKSLHVKQKAG